MSSHPMARLVERQMRNWELARFKLDPTTSARFDLSLHLERFAPDQAVEVISKARQVKMAAASEVAAVP